MLGYGEGRISEIIPQKCPILIPRTWVQVNFNIGIIWVDYHVITRNVFPVAAEEKER